VVLVDEKWWPRYRRPRSKHAARCWLGTPALLLCEDAACAFSNCRTCEEDSNGKCKGPVGEEEGEEEDEEE